MRVLDWEAIEAKAAKMSNAELAHARKDCIEAGAAAWGIEKSGGHVDKDQGYYHDEASVYRSELKKRIERTGGAVK